MILPEKGYRRTAAIVFYIVLAIIGAYLFFKYIFVCILPFAVAFVIAASTRKTVKWLCEKLKISRTFSVLAVTLLVLGIIFAALYMLLYGVFNELSRLAIYLTSENLTQVISEITASFTGFAEKYLPQLSAQIVPFIEDLSKDIDTLIALGVQKILPGLIENMVALFKGLPKLVLFAGTVILALYYFACDYEKITGFIVSQLNEHQKKFVFELKNQFFVTILSVLRAYTILMVMTFVELWVGFSILRVEYATILAIITALVDILPVLGTGTVLLPWGIIAIITGNLKTGLSILALYVIITVVRQIAEPKILGDSVGMHPLVTLVAMYFGLKLFGVAGIFIFPIVVIIIKNLNEQGSIRLYKNPEPTEEEKKTLTRKKFKSILKHKPHGRENDGND